MEVAKASFFELRLVMAQRRPTARRHSTRAAGIHAVGYGGVAETQNPS